LRHVAGARLLHDGRGRAERGHPGLFGLHVARTAGRREEVGALVVEAVGRAVENDGVGAAHALFLQVEQGAQRDHRALAVGDEV
ncbi:hypothetical protein DKP78_22760, partial [Enterococcus faecium]